jgi:endonuclease/exonuclease/phosphatase family metal-dependent hydrolase
MLKIGAWNLNEGLAQPGRSELLTESVLRQDNDVMVLGDAYWRDNPLHDTSEELVESALERFTENGYANVRTEYDEGHPWGGRGLMALTRLDVISRSVRLGGRNALELDVFSDGDSSFRLIGAHFDDASETRRIGQAVDAADYLDGTTGPAALIGDLNALHGADGRSRLLARSTVGSLAERLPSERARGILGRLHEMGWGSTFRILESRGLEDVDPEHRPTFPSFAPLFHLDRCFVNGAVTVRDFEVASSHAGFSDHLPISVSVET